ncbi:MAG TPA: LptA/OstA family protein [Desulfobaccales bacterium]|nr:LptA/OstA family protein [Desulfobaccales bacterium]
MRRNRILALAGLLVMFWAVSFPAEGAAPKKSAGEVPLRITAARLEAEQQEGTIIFSGQVKAIYGDATLYADQLRVHFKPKPEQPKGAARPAQEKADQSPLGDLGAEKIDRIVAKGNVRMVQEDRVATGDEAIYYKDRDEVVLKGNPQLWRAENTLKGERIIFNLATNKVLVESSPQRRVEALLYSKGASEGKASQPGSPNASKSRQP